jgi:hypothetical protein
VPPAVTLPPFLKAMSRGPAPGEPVAVWQQRDEHHRLIRLVVGSTSGMMNQRLVATVGPEQPEPPEPGVLFRISGS